MKTNVQIKDEPIEIPNCSIKTVQQSLNLSRYDQITKYKSKNSMVNQEQEVSACVWCQKLGSKSFMLHTDDGDSNILCSEICFNQYRRASFKRNKDSRLPKIHQTSKRKSINGAISEKKSKPIGNEYNQQDTNRGKIFSPYCHSTQPKSTLPTSKRHCSSFSNEKPSSNLPFNLTYSPSVFLPPSPVNLNRFQPPFFPSSPLRTTSSEHSPSTLFSTLTKGLLSNYTCILPTFIPLPIPIPFCLPLPSPCVKCSINVLSQESQTELSNNIHTASIHQKRLRRISF